MKKIILLMLLLIKFSSSVNAQQSVAINTTGNPANPSAILDVSSTSKGMLMPRMTSAQRTGILNTAVGLMVFDTGTNSFWYYQSSGWTELQSNTSNPWQKSGNDIYTGNTGNVGIGITTPSTKFEVKGGIKTDSVFIVGGNSGDNGNSGDFLIKENGNGKLGFKKGFSGLGLNYCIALDGYYPPMNKPILGERTESVLGAEPFIGEIILFAGTFPPRGYAFCNGQLLSIGQYDALFSVLGFTYGGNGTTTFALPDLRDAVPVHAGTNWILGGSNR